MAGSRMTIEMLDFFFNIMVLYYVENYCGALS